MHWPPWVLLFLTTVSPLSRVPSSWAIQLAKWGGAYVSCTCSSSNFELVASLGCDRPIDYHVERFEDIDWEREGGSGPDVVLDLIGGEYEMRSLSLLPKRWWGRDGSEGKEGTEGSEGTEVSRRGHYLHVMNSGWQTYFRSYWLKKVLYPMVLVGFTSTMWSLAQVRVLGLDYSFTIVCPDGQDLALIAALMEQGTCRAVIDSVKEFSAEAMRNGHDKSEAGHCRGKIVLEVGGGGGRSLRSKL